MVAWKFKTNTVTKRIKGGEPASRDEVVGGEDGITAEVGVDVPGGYASFSGGGFVGGDIRVGDFGDRESEDLGFEGGEEGIEIGFGHGIVRLDIGVDEPEEDTGGASIGIDGAVWPGGVRGDVGIKLGRIGVDAESGKKDVPGDSAREGVIFLEVTLFGGGQVASFDQSAIIGGNAGLLGDGFEEVGGPDSGGGRFGLCGRDNEAQR